jgi:predicted phosphodiesterase
VPVLILSDIHANLEALEAVLADARGRYDRIVCLGDLVDYGADPNAVVDWARANIDVTVRGNHDRACGGLEDLSAYNPAAQVSAVWTRDTLTPENAQFLRRLPRGPVPYIAGGHTVDLVHGSPLDEDEYLIGIPEVRPVLHVLEESLTFFGHTHIQGGFLLTRNGVRRIQIEGTIDIEPEYFFLVNPGSVGQPRDGDPRAAYALYSPTAQTVEYRRVEYDIARAVEKIRAAGLPDSLARRLLVGM